jgi:type IV secretory pathway VirD2 relaxase
MPPGTNPEKVYTAVQSFCREEFALKHRYVMALHTDEHHPHVHVVLRASDELGKRLNIKKAHLKDWREKFAAHLREQGVPANATPRMSRMPEQKTQRLATYWKDRREAAEANPRADSRQDAPAPPKTHEPRVR